MSAASPQTAGVVIEPVDRHIPVIAAVVSFARATGATILESSLEHGSYGRFSIFTGDPVDVFSIHRCSLVCPFRLLADRVGAYPAVGAANDGLPFHGGWIGFVTYEAGLAIEGIGSARRRDPAFPLVRFALYDSAAIYDHVDRRWYVIAVDWPPGTVQRPPVAERLSALRRRLAEARSVPGDSILAPTTDRVQPNMSYEAYLGRVHRAKRYIEAGDVYQVNLAQRFTARGACGNTTDQGHAPASRRCCGR